MPDNCTPILASLLNSDCKLLIKNYLFKLDFNEETVMAYNLDISQKKIFSFEDDVLEILFSDDPFLRDGLKSMPMACGGREKNVIWADCDIKMKYYRAGVYYWLTGSISTDRNDRILIMTVDGSTCCYKSTNDIFKTATADDEDFSKAKITVYEGMRRLNSFYFKADYDVYDRNRDPIDSKWVDLGCFCDNCGCVEGW
ncbi:MAG: hypothetical protein ACOCUV_02920 [bacterium]